jgi:hypothetical protein
MLGEIKPNKEKRKTYLNIKDGAIVCRTEQGEKRYAFVEGRLESITTKERTFRNETVVYWYVDLRDTDTGDLYSLGFPYNSNIFKGVVLSLASDEALTRNSVVRIEPYTKNGYDKVVVWSDGVKLDWVTQDLPPVESLSVGGRYIKDDSKRMQLIASFADLIATRLK